MIKLALKKKKLLGPLPTKAVVFWGYKGKKLIATITNRFGDVLMWRTTRLLGFVGKRQYTMLAKLTLIQNVATFLIRKKLKSYGLIIKSGYRRGIAKTLTKEFKAVSKLR